MESGGGGQGEVRSVQNIGLLLLSLSQGDEVMERISLRNGEQGNWDSPFSFIIK